MEEALNKKSGKRLMKTEPLLGIGALLLLLGGCFLVLKPFLSALMWAIVLAYTLYPMQRMFTRWFHGRRTIAACLVTLTISVLVAGPIVLVGVSLAEDGKELATATRDWFMDVPEESPEWISGIPVVGDELDGYWVKFAKDKKRWMEQIDRQVKAPPSESELPAEKSPAQVPPTPTETNGETEPGAAEPSLQDMAEMALEGAVNVDGQDESPHLIVWAGKFLSSARTWLLSAAKAVGQAVTQVLFSAFLAFFFLRDSETLSKRLSVGVERLAGKRGKHLVKVAGDTVRGVIYGILGTAVAQAVVAGLGFWIAGVPGAVLLAVVVFFFAVIPYGPPIVWVPAAIWLFAQDQVGYSIFLLIWGVAVISSVDNFLRPFLISQGSKMPFALIFCGVIGGALAFGLVGVFIGPTILAVAFRLIDEWSSGKVDLVKESEDEPISALPSSP